MTSGGGRTIARVSVRVIPDTTGFKRKVEADLAQLRDATVNVQINFEVDRKKLQAQLKAAEAGLKVTIPVEFDIDKGVLAAAKAAAKTPIKVPAEVDRNQLEASAKDAAAKTTVTVPGEINWSKVFAGAQAAVDKQKITLNPEKLDWGKIFAGAQAEADKVRVRIPVTVDATKEFSQLRSVAALTAGAIGGLFKDTGTRIASGLGLSNQVREFKGLATTAKTGARAIGTEFSSMGTGVRKVMSGLGSEFKSTFSSLGGFARLATGDVGKAFDAVGKRMSRSSRDGVNSISQDFSHLANAASIVTGAIGGAFSLAFSSMQSAGSSALSAVGGAFDTFGGKVSDTLGSLSSVGEALGPVSDVIGSIVAGVQKVVTVTAGLIKVVAIGTAIAEAGAGIAAAWGFAATAIAAVPAAIGLIGTPIAAVLVGMDGIKKAFKSIDPQVKQFRKTVSDAFEKGLTPVLKTIGNELLPKLGIGLAGTATALSGVATATGDWVARGPGLAILSTTIGNINTAISQINLIPILDGFLRLAGNKAALDALVTTINGVGTSLQAIADNKSLDAAFTGLGQVLGAVERGFTGLVNNGIKLFATAAPSIRANLDAITNFFGKFDYARLGAAIGQAFQGVGDAINQIPAGTIESITRGFEGLGRALDSPSFKTGLSGMADLIPPLLSALKGLVIVFGLVGDAVKGVELAFGIAAINIGQVTDTLGLTDGAAQRATENFVNLAKQVHDSMNQVQTDGTSAISGLAIAMQDETGKIPQFANQNLGQLPGIAASAVNKTIGLFGTGLGTLSVQTQKDLGLIPQDAKVALDPLAPTVGAATQAMADAANAAIPGLGTAFQTGFAALGPLVDTAFATLNTTNIPTAMLAMGTAITAGITTSIGPAFTLGFASLGPVIDTAFATLSAVSIASGFIVMGAAFTAGFLTNIGPAFTAGFLTLGPVVDTAFATLSATSIATGFIVMGTAFVAGFLTNIVPAINSGFVLVNTAFTTGFSTIATTSVTPGMVAVAAAVTAGFLGVIAAVTDGMNAAVVSANVGFTDLNTSAVTGMATFTESIKAGAANVIAEVTSMVDAAIQEANKLEAGFKAAGANAVAAMAAAIRAGQNEVVNAARETVQAANAAAQNAAKINSPSRVWYGFGTGMIEGGVDGLHDDTPKFEAAARKSVISAMAAAQSEVDTGTKLNLAAAFTQATGTLAAKVSTELTSAKAPVLLATIQNIMDGKVLDERTQTLITSWERELLSAHRSA